MPLLAEAKMSFWSNWKGRFLKFAKAAKTASKNMAVFVAAGSVAGSVIGFYNSWEDRITDRHERAWSVIRTAMTWSREGASGNVGQNNAIEILTRHCQSWTNVPPFSYVLSVFFQDCVPLRSLTLKFMDFRALDASGGDLSDSDLACSNFSGAKLRGTKLLNVNFHAADLKNADLSEADLDNVCFDETNLAGVNLTRVRHLDAKALLRACILKTPGEEKELKLRLTFRTYRRSQNESPIVPVMTAVQ